MNEREVGELRRRFKPERGSFSHIRGCYVNELGHIVSLFDQSLAMMSQDESELFLSVLRKTLSGGLGKNLMDIEFETKEVAYGENHRLLMDLRNSGLKDEIAVKTFFEKVAAAVKLEDSSYLNRVRFNMLPWKVSGDSFDDVAESDYFYAPVDWGVNAGIVNGYGDRVFGPKDTLTREQFASLLYRFAQFKGYDPEALALAEKAVLVREGDMLLFAICPEAEALLDAFRAR